MVPVSCIGEDCERRTDFDVELVIRQVLEHLDALTWRHGRNQIRRGWLAKSQMRLHGAEEDHVQVSRMSVTVFEDTTSLKYRIDRPDDLLRHIGKHVTDPVDCNHAIGGQSCSEILEAFPSKEFQWYSTASELPRHVSCGISGWIPACSRHHGQCSRISGSRPTFSIIAGIAQKETTLTSSDERKV